MNKAYEVADRLMEWVSSLLHRITGESSPVWDRIVYGILVFVIAIVVARILRMIVIYVIHRIIKYKGGDLLKGLVEAKVFTHITHVIPPLVILSLLPFAFHGTPELLRIIEKFAGFICSESSFSRSIRKFRSFGVSILVVPHFGIGR